MSAVDIHPPVPSHETDVVRDLVRCFGLLRRYTDPYFARFGISASQWGVLRVLHRAEEEDQAGLRLTDLGDRLLVRPPSITGVVDRLHRQGLLQRTRAPKDSRAKQITLTEAGRELVQRVLVDLPAQHATLFVDFNEQEKAQLHQLLQ